MTINIERLFRDFQRTRDPKPLAKVFDAVAPDLLAAAIHFERDANSAEDLVQATFLTAIERAGEYQPDRKLRPWLMGILSNHANNQRRSTRKVPDQNRVRQSQSIDPHRAAETKEKRQRIAAAIDQLEEPYRKTLILNLQHGLSPAEIAHVLAESPGTIRVRIHRGIERLKKILPASIAVSMMVAAPTLAAVRKVVMTQAAKELALFSTSTSLLYGGALVTKKTLVLGGILMVVALATWLVVKETPDENEVSVKPDHRSTTSASLEPKRSHAKVIPKAESEVGDEQTNENPGQEYLVGKVIDGVSGEAIPNVAFEVHLKHKVRTIDLQKKWGRLTRCTPRFLATNRGWPAPESWLSDVAQAGREEFAVSEPPAPNDIPEASTRSDADGAFTLPLGQDSGILRCHAAGYVERFVVGEDAKKAKVISMWPAQTLYGSIIDPKGKAIKEKVALVFRDHRRGENLGPWTTTTDEAGNFEVVVGAPQVQARVLNPGYLMLTQGVHPSRPGPWTTHNNYRTGNKDRPIYIVLRKVAVIRVRDAQTKQPIEDLFFKSRDAQNGYAQLSGHIFAPGGLIELDRSDGAARSEVWLEELRNARREFTIWATGFESKTVQVARLFSLKEDIVVELDRGSLSELSGTVRQKGQGAPGIEIALFGHSPRQWGEDRNYLIDATRSQANGAFRFAMPAGKYLLRIKHEGHVHCRVVSIPSSRDLTIELDRLASVVVLMKDTRGNPVTDHTVVLKGSDGRNHWESTNSKGNAHFERLPGGKFEILVPNKTTKGSFSPDQILPLVLNESENKRIDVTLPSAADSIHPRLVVEGQERLEGWIAQYGITLPRTKVQIAANGDIPINIPADEARRLEIVSPKGQIWEFPVPKNLGEAWEIRIPEGGKGYAGRVLNWSGDKALKGMIVRATPIGKGQPTHYQATTDKDGHFELSGLRDSDYNFRIEAPRSRRVGTSARLNLETPVRSIWLKMHDAPTSPPQSLDINFPLSVGKRGELEEVKITGKVLKSGSALPDAIVYIYALYDRPRYFMQLTLRSSTDRTQSDGRYAVAVPRAPRYRASVFLDESRMSLGPHEWTVLGKESELHQDISYD
ncbi:MAG: sigma-70 family RNA polymerase sigma factor [Planctomycetota bacterium]